MEIYLFDRELDRRVVNFNNFNLDLVFNSVGSTFSFEFYFNPKIHEHRLIANMTRYQVVKIEDRGKRIFTGFIINQDFAHKSKKTLLTVSGYSIPAVLGDAQVPISTYPRQHNGMSLREITLKLLAPFKISLKVDDVVAKDVDRRYDETAASVTETVQAYLEGLCKQRDIVMTHTEGGRLLLTRADTNITPFLDVVDIDPPVYEAYLKYDGQSIHSQISIIGEQSDTTGNARAHTEHNPMVPEWTTKFNPKVREQSEGDDVDTRKAVIADMAIELRQAVVLILKLSTWYINDELITPNRIITIQSDELNLPKKERFFVESVSLTLTESEETCEMRCVLPEVYNGNLPRNIFVI